MLTKLKETAMKLVVSLIAALAITVAVSLPADATLLDGTTIVSRFDQLPSPPPSPTYAGPVSTVTPGTISPYPNILTDNGVFSVTYADTSIQMLSTGSTVFGGVEGSRSTASFSRTLASSS